MEQIIYSQLRKSRSMCSLAESESASNVTIHKNSNFRDYRRTHNRTTSDSSVEICIIDSDSDDPAQHQFTDSGIADTTVTCRDMVQVLEQKIDRLNDMFKEQCKLLTTLKEEISSSKTTLDKVEVVQSDIVTDLVKKAVFQSGIEDLDYTVNNAKTNSSAKSLLDAIEFRQGSALDREISDALASFLHSEELTHHMVAATAESVKDVIGNCISRDVSNLYLPVIEHSHRRLVRSVTKTIEDAFTELDNNSKCLFKSMTKVTKSLRHSIDRHNSLLDAATDPHKNLIPTLKCTVEGMLHAEINQWRQKVLHVFSPNLQYKVVKPPEAPKPQLEYTSASPQQPADSNYSAIDQLMISAKISKQISEGDANGAFERALSAADLRLVTAACRAADHTAVFTPVCRLQQHVMLALLQQLSTDMTHDTMLKCRYLEESIINLNPKNPVTRSHLPLVVGEVHKNLTNFISCNPSHGANRRIALIIMAANNLLK